MSISSLCDSWLMLKHTHTSERTENETNFMLYSHLIITRSIQLRCISSIFITHLYYTLYYSKKIHIYQIYQRATMSDTLKDIYAKSV